MRDFFSPYKLLIEIVLIGGLFIGAVWGAHLFLEHEREIGRTEVRAEYATKLQEAKDAAKLVENALNARIAAAELKGNEREQTIRTVAASGAAASSSLRDTLANIRGGVSSNTVEALGKSVTTLATVFAECQGRYLEVATAADRHANDSAKYQAAWPVVPQPTK